MTEVLAAAEQAVAHACARAICQGHSEADAQTRTDTHQVVGMAMRLEQRSCGAYSTHPPVIVSFHREQWLRIAIGLRALEMDA